MKLSLNISPCPNDTFMFDALVNGRIDTKGLEFEVQYHDIEELNSRAINGEADITKISYAVLPLVERSYTLLDSGSALGRGNGPLLVRNPRTRMDSGGVRVAVPGYHTTANLLLERLHPELTDKTPVLFSEIADAVMNGTYDAGLLIHEGRFTYSEKGLLLVSDLGKEWEERTGLLLPLGGIVASRSLPGPVVSLFEELLRESILYAMADPAVSREYVKSHAREMDGKVIDSHISLFVNEYSVSLGDSGRKAVRELTSAG